jgi:hypothetical protein
MPSSEPRNPYREGDKASLVALSWSASALASQVGRIISNRSTNFAQDLAT